ncbi:hypothetical protein RSAG8_12113, partial [Rhizoctonia solani AG-8 WAC10335]
MSTAYRSKPAGYRDDPDILSAIRLAMGYWFANDYSTLGTDLGTEPTYSLITPLAVLQAFGMKAGISIAVIGIDAGLLENNKTGNASKIADAYERVHNQQHNGIIFDGMRSFVDMFNNSRLRIVAGNYGKDFINSLLDLELLALNTQFPANQTTKDIFGFHLDGSRRMTFTNTLSKVIRWDFDLIEVGTALAEAANDRSVIAAKLTGGRVFWSSDYMIHRTDRTVTTVKMLSNRTSTSKCTNSEGPYNFHLSDEAVYTYTTGAEYEDMFAALDYNIIPGIITDYNGTVLDCGTVAADGIDTYAGGVEADDIGMAAM